METVTTTLRLPTSLKAAIDRSAAANRRSVNSEIVVMLEAATAAEPNQLPASAGGVPAAEHRLRA
ncbi:Arc family DNA-binding protein [Rhodovarius lipocyclicus]|uniref:Arc family DNA-binding protein n=1 Tax=Rhodovarius lipocyclicus TaxID=268410 RepID=UPI0013586529|nr:Arc family DNA-binding protein [Rhodovarius lipocyclicus]